MKLLKQIMNNGAFADIGIANVSNRYYSINKKH